MVSRRPALPATVVTASSSSSGRARPTTSASASSWPGSQSRMNGIRDVIAGVCPRRRPCGTMRHRCRPGRCGRFGSRVARTRPDWITAARFGGGHMQKRFGLTLFAGLAIIVAACGGWRRSTAPSAAASVAPSVAPSEAPSRRAVDRAVGRGDHLRRRRSRSASSPTSVASTTRASTSPPTRACSRPPRRRPTCFETEYIETTSQSDYATNIAQFTDSGSNVVIGVGFLLGDALGDAAKANSDIKFISVDGVPNAGHDESWMTERRVAVLRRGPGRLPGRRARRVDDQDRTTSASSAASSSSRRSSASSRATSTARSRSSPTSRSTSSTRPRSPIRPRAAMPPSR